MIIYCLSFQQHFVVSMHRPTFLQELKDKVSWLDAIFLYLEAQSHSVKENVAKTTFSLKQLLTEPTMINTAWNTMDLGCLLEM